MSGDVIPLHQNLLSRPEIGAFHFSVRSKPDPVLKRALGEFDLINVGTGGPYSFERDGLQFAQIDDHGLKPRELLARSVARPRLIES